MQSTTITRITTGSLAALLAGSVGYGIHQTNQADAARSTAAAWQQEAAGWQTAAASTQVANEKLVRTYNNLVTQTRQAEQAQTAAAAVPATPVTAAVASTPAPAAPAVQAAPAQAPTSQAS